MLNPQHFFRASRSFIVHIKSVDKVQPFFNGKLKLTLKPVVNADEVIAIRKKASEFKQWMGK